MVRFLEYENNQQIPVRIGYSALKAVKDKFGKSLDELTKGGDDNLEAFEVLLVASVKSGYRATLEECPFDLTDPDVALDLMDACLFQLKEVLPDFFQGMIPPAEVTSRKPAKKKPAKK